MDNILMIVGRKEEEKVVLSVSPSHSIQATPVSGPFRYFMGILNICVPFCISV